MAVTAETRTSIIQLVVTAYNGAPGTTLLTELVEAADGGASLADIATTLTTSATFKGLYPTFQTATEFAEEFLTALVPSASAAARAEGIAAVEAVLNGGGTRADVILQAQTFLAGLSETDANFGTPAAAFNNKVEVATYHTVTKEQDGDLGARQSAISSVTNDEATVTSAKTTIDTGSAVTGSTTTLTTSVDTVSGTSGDDTIKGVVSSTTGQTTLGAGDDINGQGGTDSMEIIFDGTGDFGPVATIANVEKFYLKNFGTAANTANLANITGITEVWNDGSSQNVDVTNLSSLAKIGVRNTTTDTDITFTNTAVAGSADELTVEVQGGDTGTDVTVGATSGTEGVETIIVHAGGTAASRLNSLNSDQADFTTLKVTGDQKLTLDSVDDTLTTIDASGNTAGLTATISAATSAKDVKFTGTAATDVITTATTTTADVLDGGDGVDALVATGTFGATASNFESLTLVTGAGEQTPSVDLDKAQDIAAITVNGTTLGSTFGSLSFTNLPANPTISLSSNGTSAIDAASTFSLKTSTGSSDQLTLKFSGSGAYNFTTTAATANGIEQVNIDTTANGNVTFNIADLFGQTTDVLKKVVLTGSGQIHIDASLNGGTGAMELDASAMTGLVEMTAAVSAGATTAKFSNLNNAIVTGAGADTITAGSGNDTITSGASSDTITLGGGNDTVVTTIGAAYATADADKVGGFGGGATGDNIDIDLSDVEAIASVTDLVTGNSTSLNAENGLTINEITKGTGETLAAADDILVFTGGTYADNAALLADIGQTAGTTKLTWGAAPATNDAILAAYSDGTDVHIVVIADAAANTNTTMENAELTITTLVTLTGNSSITASEFNSANFDIIA